ncbi:MAG: hypothetical protein ACR2KM_06655 [Gemmatimonadaceae bacterium]
MENADDRYETPSYDAAAQAEEEMEFERMHQDFIMARSMDQTADDGLDQARADGLAARNAITGGESFEQRAIRAQRALSAIWPDNELVHVRIGNKRRSA